MSSIGTPFHIGASLCKVHAESIENMILSQPLACGYSSRRPTMQLKKGAMMRINPGKAYQRPLLRLRYPWIMQGYQPSILPRARVVPVPTVPWPVLYPKNRAVARVPGTSSSPDPTRPQSAARRTLRRRKFGEISNSADRV